MKDFFSTEVNAIRTELDAIKEQMDALLDKDVNERDFLEKGEIARLNDRESVLRIKLMFYHDNNRQMLVHSVLPIICEEFSKYIGKPYGAKTKEKIADAIKSRCNCYCYISINSYSQTLSITPLNEDGCSYGRYNDYDMTIYSNNGFYISADNKIGNIFDVDFSREVPRFFKVDNCHRTIAPSTIDALAEEIVRQGKELNAMWDRFGKAISEYNALLPSAMPSKSQYNYKMF